MAQKNKLQKFEEFASFPNSYENFNMKHPALQDAAGNEIDLRGIWNAVHFKSEAPIILELACGRGEYTVEMARRLPEKHFIGVDIKGARIWKGARIALREKLANAAFLRTRIETIDHFFGPGEVSEIWITFPDPFEKRGKANRRLTSQNFFSRYRNILNPSGLVHLKTDAESLYRYTLEVIHADPRCVIEYAERDIYAGPLENPLLEIKTYYERMHLEEGRKIGYIRFRISG